MKTCLVMIRDPKRTKGATDIYPSEILYDKVVKPVVEQHGIVCERIDPHDYGINDSRLFNLIQSADFMLVDVSSNSMDYMYSLGIRHALTDKPTILLAEREDVPMDVGMPFIVRYPKHSLSFDECHSLQSTLADILFSRLKETEMMSFSPVLTALEQQLRVFLSYAHADVESVVAIDQWLRNKGARVDLDERNFIAGRDIRDEIVRHVRRAGKVVCFFSKNSSDRYYPKLERRLSEELERELYSTGKPTTVLVYFRLDDTPLPSESAHRLAINAWNMGFEEACKELWRNLLERESEPRSISLSKYRKSPPWKQEK